MSCQGAHINWAHLNNICVQGAAMFRAVCSLRTVNLLTRKCESLTGRSRKRLQRTCLWGQLRHVPNERMCRTNLRSGAKRFRDFREYSTSAPAELGGEIHNVSRNRTRTKVLLQVRRLHVYGSGSFGAFWQWSICLRPGRAESHSKKPASRATATRNKSQRPQFGTGLRHT